MRVSNDCTLCMQVLFYTLKFNLSTFFFRFVLSPAQKKFTRRVICAYFCKLQSLFQKIEIYSFLKSLVSCDCENSLKCQKARQHGCTRAQGLQCVDAATGHGGVAI